MTPMARLGSLATLAIATFGCALAALVGAVAVATAVGSVRPDQALEWCDAERTVIYRAKLEEGSLAVEAQQVVPWHVPKSRWRVLRSSEAAAPPPDRMPSPLVESVAGPRAWLSAERGIRLASVPRPPHYGISGTMQIIGCTTLRVTTRSLAAATFAFVLPAVLLVWRRRARGAIARRRGFSVVGRLEGGRAPTLSAAHA